MKNLIVSRIIEEFSEQDYSFRDLNGYTKFVPDSGYVLEFNIKSMPMNFPEPGFAIYSVFMPNWKVVESGQKKALNSEINPDCLFVDYTRPYLMSRTVYDRFYVHLKNDYLVAYNSSTDKIIYLSGRFYLDNYTSSFPLNIDVPSSFYEYLMLRLYMFSAKEISFEGYTKKQIWFAVVVDWAPNTIYVGLDKHDYSKTDVQYAKPNVKKRLIKK